MFLDARQRRRQQRRDSRGGSAPGQYVVAPSSGVVVCRGRRRRPPPTSFPPHSDSSRLLYRHLPSRRIVTSFSLGLGCHPRTRARGSARPHPLMQTQRTHQAAPACFVNTSPSRCNPHRTDCRLRTSLAAPPAAAFGQEPPGRLVRQYYSHYCTAWVV